MEKVVKEGRSHDPQRGQYVDSLHQGRESGIRAAQDEEGGRGAGAGDTGEEKRVKKQKKESAEGEKGRK